MDVVVSSFKFFASCSFVKCEGIRTRYFFKNDMTRIYFYLKINFLENYQMSIVYKLE